MGWLWLVLLACPAPLDAVNHCDPGQDCLPCEADAECVVAANPCGDVAVCGHVDDELAVIELGCSAALERPLPPFECECRGSCAFEEGSY